MVALLEGEASGDKNEKSKRQRKVVTKTETKYFAQIEKIWHVIYNSSSGVFKLTKAKGKLS